MLCLLVPALLAGSAAGEYSRLADAGNVRAQVVAGELALRNGDTGLAFARFEAAAKAGDWSAGIRLADLYLDGRGTVRNPEKAAHWYAMATGESAEAQWKLGALFQDGDGVPRNPEIAAALYRRAAEQGFADAQNSLATLYVAGFGVTQSYEHALEWYQKAAEQNCADAQLNLAGLYFHGVGVKQDLGLAHKWALRARALKIREAEHLLLKIEQASSSSNP